MVTPPAIALLIAVAALVLVAYAVVRAIKPFVVNTVVGLLVLLVASFLGFGVNISWIVVLVVAIGGIPGAVLVLILAHLDIVFQTAMVSLPL